LKFGCVNANLPCQLKGVIAFNASCLAGLLNDANCLICLIKTQKIETLDLFTNSDVNKHDLLSNRDSQNTSACSARIWLPDASPTIHSSDVMFPRQDISPT